METKFNFNSQICTTREQSKRLLALGLKKETADMGWVSCVGGKWSIVDRSRYYAEIPAWSLHRLLLMLDYDVQTDGRYIALPDYGFAESDNIYDNLCDCIEWLIKKGYFPKEYLVDLTGTDSHQDLVDSFRYALEAFKEGGMI